MLIVKEPTEKFNTEEIRRGTLVYAKHKTWENGEKGFVTTASEDEVIVQYPPKIGNVTNHFFTGRRGCERRLGSPLYKRYGDDSHISGRRNQ